ncbi:radical SAM protein [Pseudomonas gozinkensis]|uniref:radical SAM protein n=1 Tax=Pseudomonas gozinkensis TaxID=2774461 RepID=UPI001787972A|nr:radical SAM protein [Pseudomonas gozinkensis]
MTSQVCSLGFPIFVKWYITSKCNIRCTHCYLEDYTYQENDLPRIFDTIDFLAANQVRSITLLGGEPMVRKDLSIIAKRITEKGMILLIVTNGTLITPALVAKLKASGAVNYQVSIEGHTAQLNDGVRGDGNFSKAMTGVGLLVEAGMNVTLSITITKKNHQSARKIFELAYGLGVQEIKFSAFVPTGTGAGLDDSHSLTPQISSLVSSELWNLHQEYPSIKIVAGPFFNEVKWHNKKTAATSTFGCGAATTSIVINSDFSLSACDMLTEKDRTRPMVDSESIQRVWNEDPIFLKWRGQLLASSNYEDAKNFSEVHRHGCHLAYNVYGKNIFE